MYLDELNGIEPMDNVTPEPASIMLSASASSCSVVPDARTGKPPGLETETHRRTGSESASSLRISLVVQG
jgi:hypothetical protein